MLPVDFVGVALEFVCIDVEVVSLDGVGDIVVMNVVILVDVDLVVERNLEDRADENTVDTFDVDIGVVLDFSVENITDDVLGDESDATAVTEVVIKVPLADPSIVVSVSDLVSVNCAGVLDRVVVVVVIDTGVGGFIVVDVKVVG